MRDRTLFGQRLVALFLAGCLLFSYPLLAIVNGGSAFGIPRLYLYLFAAWVVLILLLVAVAERSR